MGSSTRQPIVYISYRWIDVVHENRPARAPDPRARELADDLRSEGVDVRFDLYFRDSLHGFKPPQRVAGDPRDPWLAWSHRQVAEADAVLMFCTAEYAEADPDHGEPQGDWWRWCQLPEAARISTRVPALWWDWLAIARECDHQPEKYIPIGIGPYHSDQVPGFIRGASYLNLADEDGFNALLRRIRQAWRAHVPRGGVFISYAHKDDQSWLDQLLIHLSWIKRQHGVEFWTDRDIEPGEKWHEMIRSALDGAQVGMMLVSPDFLNSDYIMSNELPKMLDAAESDGLRIFPIILRPSSYKRSTLARFQAANNPDRPLSTMTAAELDQAFVDIGEKLARALGLTGT